MSISLIPVATQYVAQYEDYDQNGILNVSAKDLGTGKETTVRIEESSGLSEEEIDRMQKDAEANADDDKKQRELVELRNKADSMAYQLEKTMKENADKIGEGDKAALIDDLKQALYASKIVSYAQGYQLMRAAADEHGWTLNNGEIALMWRGGCIIRSAFLGNIKQAFDTDPNLVNLLLDPFFKDAIETAQAAWRRVIMKSVEMGIPMPAISAALAYFDGYRSARLPANLLQAQRDYFGAHTYERLDKPRGEFFDTNWTGRGGDTAASTYIV